MFNNKISFIYIKKINTFNINYNSSKIMWCFSDFSNKDTNNIPTSIFYSKFIFFLFNQNIFGIINVNLKKSINNRSKYQIKFNDY